MRYSIIIPGCECGQPLAAELPELEIVLRRLVLPFEVICVEEPSASGALRPLETLINQYPWLRLLRVEAPRGMSAAIVAGVAAARGEIVVVIDLARHEMRQIPNLIAGLARTDFVVGRRKAADSVSSGIAPHRVGRFSRHAAATDPKSPFWAARREAVADLRLAAGMGRHLPRLVALRGFRVGEPTFGRQQPKRLALPRAVSRLALWWLERGWQPSVAREIQPSATVPEEQRRSA